MTTLAGTPQSTVHDADALDDDALRTLFAYPDGLDHPLVRANFIASIDGAVTLDGSGRKLGTPTDRRVFGRLREVADVVLVGASTATAKPYVDMQMVPRPRRGGWRTASPPFFPWRSCPAAASSRRNCCTRPCHRSCSSPRKLTLRPDARSHAREPGSSRWRERGSALPTSGVRWQRRD